MAKYATLVGVGALGPMAVMYLTGTSLLSITTMIQELGGIAAVAAGVAFLICWKVGGRAGQAWMAMAFVILGALSVAHSRLAVASVGLPVGRDPYGPLIPCGLAAAAFIGAITTAEVDAGLDPVRTLAVTVPAGLFLVALLDFATGGHPTAPWMMAVSRAVCGLVWLALAGVSVRARRRPAPLGGWVVGFFGIQAAVDGLAAATDGRIWGPPLVSAVFMAACVLGLTAAGQDLRWALRGQDRHSLALRHVVDDLRDQLRRERAELDEQLHDLRNAVTGIRTADSTLRRYAGQLDEDTRTSLADALTSELSRLQVLIEPGRALRRDDFLLAEALCPVVSTARSTGTEVEVQVGRLAVRGDRESLAQVLQNLLTNARRYAPGSPVSILAARTGDRIRIEISDQGPGIPAAESSAIFERGVRGTSSAGRQGSGLGLYVARRLMSEMRGDLYLADSGGVGARFVVELPASPQCLPETTAPPLTLAQGTQEALERSDLHA